MITKNIIREHSSQTVLPATEYGVCIGEYRELTFITRNTMVTPLVPAEQMNPWMQMESNLKHTDKLVDAVHDAMYLEVKQQIKDAVGLIRSIPSEITNKQAADILVKLLEQLEA